MYLGDFASIMNKAYTELHAEFNGSKLHHCTLVVFAIYSFENIEQQFLSCHFESNVVPTYFIAVRWSLEYVAK